MTGSRWRPLGPVARTLTVALLVVAVLLTGAAWLAWRNLAGEPAVQPLDASSPAQTHADPAMRARGAYLARAGNCEGCHTGPGGLPYAGGRALATPFGTVYGGNLTPDIDTGLGAWSASEFRRALWHGRSRDGRLLTPAFPVAWFRTITAEDADALYAHLRSLPAVRQENRPHALRFPFNTPLALAVWRAWYGWPKPLDRQPGRSEAWHRGRYLVEGLGHCGACHTPRDRWGGPDGARSLQGGTLPVEGWEAPSLQAPDEAGVQHWSRSEVVALLKDGRNRHAAVGGPMAEVVWRSTQHLSEPDLQAMAEFLQALPASPPSQRPGPTPASETQRLLGAQVYEKHCAACHGTQGEGAGGLYLPLAGNRQVLMASPRNLVLAIRHGGFSPATAGNPRPFGMPPFGHLLSDEEIAAVATHLRQAWHPRASAVSALDVLRLR